MARHAIDEQTWETLLRVYRNAPGAHSQASRASGLDRRTCAKAWERGLPKLAGGQSIQSVIEAEKVSARARIREQEEVARRATDDEKRKAREQAVQARAQEGQVVTLARANSLSSLAASAEMLGAARNMAKRVRAKLERLLADDQAAEQSEAACEHCGRAPNVTPAHALVTLLDRITVVARRVNEASMEAMRMERLHLGEPTEIIGIKDDGRKITAEEARERLAIAQQAVDRAMKRAEQN